jgi:hypothetical protein
MDSLPMRPAPESGWTVEQFANDLLGHEGKHLVQGYHEEEYHGDAANVAGRVRLAARGTEALKREIERTPAEPAPRQARGPLMQQRMEKARRDLLRRMGNVA